MFAYAVVILALRMPSQNEDAIRRLLDAFNRKSSGEVVDLWTPDCEWRPAYTGGGLVEGAVYRGHEGIVEYLEEQAETWESIVAEVGEVRVRGDRVLTAIHIRGVGRASRVEVERPTWNVYDMRDGRVARGVVYTNEAEALEALDA